MSILWTLVRTKGYGRETRHEDYFIRYMYLKQGIVARIQIMKKIDLNLQRIKIYEKLPMILEAASDTVIALTINNSFAFLFYHSWPVKRPCYVFQVKKFKLP